MKNKLIFKVISFFIVLTLIIILSGSLGTGLFWGVKIAFGYGGGGSGGGSNPPTNTNIPPNIETPAITVEPVPIQTSARNQILKGTKTAGYAVFINDSSDNITYPSETTWQSTQTLSPGLNVFTLRSQNYGGLRSPNIQVFVTLSNSSDITGDGVIDDLDLALLVSHWGKSWQQADYNNDNIIDDLDLAYLVSRWTK